MGEQWKSVCMCMKRETVHVYEYIVECELICVWLFLQSACLLLWIFVGFFAVHRCVCKCVCVCVHVYIFVCVCVSV